MGHIKICAATYSGAVAARWVMGGDYACGAALSQPGGNATLTVRGAENSLGMLTVEAIIPVMYHGDHISPAHPIIIPEPGLNQAHYAVMTVNGYPLSNAVQVQLGTGELRVTAHNISGKTVPETVVKIVLARISSTKPIPPAAS